MTLLEAEMIEARTINGEHQRPAAKLDLPTVRLRVASLMDYFTGHARWGYPFLSLSRANHGDRWLRHPRALLACCGILVTCGAVGFAADSRPVLAATSAETATVSTIRDVQNRTGSAANKGESVHLEGRLIYLDPIKGELLLKDSTGAMKIKVDPAKIPASAGDWIELAANTAADIIHYPDRPSGSHFLTRFEAPLNVGNYYLARVRGYIYPPRTGEYTFWIASDNGGELWLSPDNIPDHARKIAQLDDIFAYTGSQDWEKQPGQRSAKITLQATQKYYIEALQWEQDGEDGLAVAWEGPGIPRTIIDGPFLSPPDDPHSSGGLTSAKGNVLREYWLGYPFQSSAEVEPYRIKPPSLETLLKNAPTLFGKPTLTDARLVRITEKALPSASNIELEQPWPEQDNFRSVMVEGLVDQVSDDGVYWTLIELNEGGKEMVLRVPNAERRSYQDLLHARVAAKGFCEGTNNAKGESVASIMWVANAQDLSLKQPIESDWSGLPGVSLRDLNAATSNYREGQRIRIFARVSAVQSDRSFEICDRVSEFVGLTSSDGETWTQMGNPIEVAMSHSIRVGLVGLSHVDQCAITFDHISIPLAPSNGAYIGKPSRPSQSRAEGTSLTISAGGNLGSAGGGNAWEDDIYYISDRFQGDGEFIARLTAVEPHTAVFPGVEGGIMMRDSLDANSPFAGITTTNEAGSRFCVRQAKGEPIENFPIGRQTPIWLKLVRRSAPAMSVHTLQGVQIAPEKLVEIVGVLRRLDNRWALTDAFYRAARGNVLGAGGKAAFDIANVQEVRQLTADELTEHRTAKIRGVVTAKTRELFIQDATGGIRLPALAWQKFAQCEVGQYIEVYGRCSPGPYSPVLEPDQQTEITLLGKGRMPAPVTATWDDLARGRIDAQWVEVSGVIRRIDGRSMKLQVAGGDLLLDLDFDLSEKNGRHLIDSAVRIQGVCSVIPNDKKQYSGVRVIVPAPEYIVTEESPPSDPFAAPTQLINSLLRFSDQNGNLHRVRVEGILTYVQGQRAFVQDSSGGIEVITPENQNLRPGTRVAVLGFPDGRGGALTLGDALYRTAGTEVLPEALTISPGQISAANYASRRVRLFAKYLGRSTLLSDEVFQFQRAGGVFQGILGQGEGSLVNIEPGSTVTLTGVCRPELNSAGQTAGLDQGFELFLSSASDIIVVHKPDWWNLKRLIWIGTAFLTVLVTALAWLAMISRKNRLLRLAKTALQQANDELEQRVAHRTSDLAMANAELSREQALLRALLDNSPDEIYFKDIQSRYVKASRAQADNFGVDSPDQLVGKTDAEFFGIDTVKPFSDDEEKIIRTGIPLIGQIRKEVRKNGQIHWMLSSKMPLRNDQNEIVGTFGVSKDISAIKEAEGNLDKLYKKLVDTSRQAGMAEVATNVLHNVGNVLNSVNVGVTYIADRVRGSRISKLNLVSQLLSDHERSLASFLTEDPRGAKLPGYLRTLVESLAEEQQALLKELGGLAKNVGHIKEIVAMQQSYAKVSGVTETVPLVEIVEDAVKMNTESFGRHGVTLIRDYLAKPTVTVEKHKVIQILVNLLRNAKNACQESGNKDKVVKIQITSDGESIKVSVVDNGVGIPAENLSLIFGHGFTTRKDGHGFGLHSGALAARELGGSLTAFSDGPGRGATFVLELALRGEAENQAHSADAISPAAVAAGLM